MGVPRASLEPYIPDSLNYYAHQVDGIRRMTQMRNVLLADDMGLGKTLQTLSAFVVDIRRGMCEKALVIVPASLVVNWQQEIHMFLRRSVHVSVVAADRKAAARKESIEAFRDMTGPRIMITTYEMLEKHLDELNEVLFDFLVFDEAHYLKNPKAQRTRNGLAIKAKRTFLLTGSPILNNVHELYTLLIRVGVPIEELGTYNRFINKFCTFSGKGGDKKITGMKNEHELMELLAKYMIRRKKEEALDLPPVQYIERVVPMHVEQKKYYRRIKMDLDLITGEPLPDEEFLEPMTKFLRYVQICGTTATVPGVDADFSIKLDLATADAHEIMASGHRVVAFTRFLGVQAAFAHRIKNHNLLAMHGKTLRHAGKKSPPVFLLNGDVPAKERQGIVRAWSLTNEPGILICTFQVAGVGLNMTAGRHALFLDKLTVPMLNKQAVDRLHRIGQSEEQPVQVFEYLVADSIEKRVNDIVKRKRAIFDKVVEGSVEMQTLIRQAIEQEAKR